MNPFGLAYLHIIEPRIKGNVLIAEGQAPVVTPTTHSIRNQGNRSVNPSSLPESWKNENAAIDLEERNAKHNSTNEQDARY